MARTGSPDGRWRLRNGLNGGYVAHLVLVEMIQAVAGIFPLTQSVNFLGRLRERDYRVETVNTPSGRNHRLVEGRVLQDDDTVVTSTAWCCASFVFGSDRPEAGWLQRPWTTGPENCEEFPARLVADVPFERQFERRTPPGLAACMLKPASGVPLTMGGWTRFADHRAVGVTDIPILMDSWPPAPHRRYGFYSSAATLELTIRWRRPPDGEWFFVWFESELLAHGYVDVRGTLWDTGGHLIAQSSQMARYRPSERG